MLRGKRGGFEGSAVRVGPLDWGGEVLRPADRKIKLPVKAVGALRAVGNANRKKKQWRRENAVMGGNFHILWRRLLRAQKVKQLSALITKQSQRKEVNQRKK